jgi:hypothetical protein
MPAEYERRARSGIHLTDVFGGVAPNRDVCHAAERRWRGVRPKAQSVWNQESAGCGREYFPIQVQIIIISARNDVRGCGEGGWHYQGGLVRIWCSLEPPDSLRSIM